MVHIASKTVLDSEVRQFLDQCRVVKLDLGQFILIQYHEVFCVLHGHPYHLLYIRCRVFFPQYAAVR